MPHVELSLSGEREPGRDRGPGAPAASSMWWWANAVAGAAEPCVVLDSDGVIVAHSETFRALLGDVMSGEDQEPAGEWVGRGLLDVLRLVDLTAAAAPLAGWESERVPPLLVLATGALARGVMRVRIGAATRTVDAISTPLWDEATLAGSLTFLCRIA